MGSLYGFEVKSELPLRRLNSAVGARGELRVEATDGPLEAPAQEPASTLIDDQGKCWYASYELKGGGCLIELPPSVSFLIEPNEGRIAVDSRDDDAELLEHRIVSAAICTLLSMRGDLVLHAAAVEVDGRAMLFCGPSLRGKSTLARALGEAGHRVLAEDGVSIALGKDEPIAFPGARGVRVRSRDRDGRQRTDLVADPGGEEPAPCPVGAVVLLGERGAALEIEPLEPARALALLTPNIVRSGGRASLSAAFARLAALLGSVPCLGVSLPDDLGALPDVARKVLDATSVRS
ncbi:MAG TPA: hypothetical protein VGH58_10510 [Solirubrobacterales bacterium]|jgi:hypothetical protein